MHPSPLPVSVYLRSGMESRLYPELWTSRPVPQVLPPGTTGVQTVGPVLRADRSEQTASVLIDLRMLTYSCPAQDS